MGLIIIPKKSISSNKTDTLPDIPPTQPIPSTVTATPVPWAPTPFLDKISVVLDPADEQDAHQIYNSLMIMQKDMPEKGKSPTDGLFLDTGKMGKWGEYKWAKRVILPGVMDQKKYPLLQCAYDREAGKFLQLRIEFVPVDLGVDGLKELHDCLSILMESGWGYFVKHGRLTRVDVAVDFQEILMDDFHFLPQQGATTKEWKVNGKLQTYTHGKPRGNHTAIYDRKEKRIAKQKPWQGKEGMRIERRFKKPPVAMLKDLADLPNPFEPMRLVSMPEAPPSEQGNQLYVWNLFRRTADAEGLTGALALLPEEKRTLYRKHLDAHTQPWWNPSAIWANWPKMLDELKIASPTAWN